MKRLKEYKSLTDFIKKNPCFEINSNKLFCNVCNEIKLYTPHDGIRNLRRHTTTKKHIASLKLKTEKHDFQKSLLKITHKKISF